MLNSSSPQFGSGTDHLLELRLHLGALARHGLDVGNVDALLENVDD